MKKYLQGKAAIVTGSGQGVRRGIARILAREGAKVVTNNRKKGSESFQGYRPEEMTEEAYKSILALKGDAETTAQLIRAEGGETVPFYGDVSNLDLVDFCGGGFFGTDIASSIMRWERTRLMGNLCLLFDRK